MEQVGFCSLRLKDLCVHQLLSLENSGVQKIIRKELGLDLTDFDVNVTPS